MTREPLVAFSLCRTGCKEFSTGYIDPMTGALGITSNQKSEIVSLLSAGTVRTTTIVP